MGRTKGNVESVSGYFRRLFADNPNWLQSGYNNEIRAQWHKDHPGQEWTQKIQQSMSNVKSILRKRAGIGRHKRRRRGGVGEVSESVVTRPRGMTAAALERLEGMIDQCLSMARQQNGEGDTLDGVIKNLRAARNGVVWQLGQPRGPGE
jgi:hypothetical protein